MGERRQKYRNAGDFIRRHWLLWAAVIITLTGFILRVICCFWGKPLQLHPDEGATVNYVIDMLERHSWEAHSYDRPDHFEIKCDAILFTIVSWIKYHKPAYEAFEEHKMAFYMLGRFFTTLFGTALIPLTGAYTHRLFGFLRKQYKNIACLTAMAIVGLSAVFVQHSAYATPDIVLTFFIILFAYGFLIYIEKGSKKALFLNMVIIGIGITIKYPAAILCLPLAVMVICREGFIEKKPLNILKYGLISIGMIFITIFVLAPNLITDVSTVYQNFIEEARPHHLGHDGLGFLGNLKFYFTKIQSKLGRVSVIPFVLGLVFIAFDKRKRGYMSLLTGLIYWVCMSVLSLHWVRWGVPVYPFYVILVSAGIGGSLQFIRGFFSKKVSRLAAGAAAAFFAALLMLNGALSGVALARYSTLPDLRYVGLAWFAENGITEENSFYEGKTPFSPSTSIQQVASFKVKEDGVQVNIEYGTKRYFIMSSSFKDSYLAEPEKYADECAVYQGIDDTYPVVYRREADGNYEPENDLLKNILYAVRYLRGHQTATGSTLTVYDLQPDNITLQNAEGAFLTVSSEEEGVALGLSSEGSLWTEYRNDNESCTLLDTVSGRAVSIGEETSDGSAVILADPTGEMLQQCRIESDGEWSYLIFSGNLALTCEENSVVLAPYTQAKNQRWQLKSE